MTGAHTPGPWMATRSLHDSRVVICTEHGRRIDVASTYAAGCGVPVEANAFLIAAAPDLLEPAPDAADLLEQYADFIRSVKADELEQHPYLPHLEQVAASLRAAIARATSKEASHG